tara:strand:- start:5 stop:169 length:165 start_codon:yes stop_codon:yes gene_type:complete
MKKALGMTNADIAGIMGGTVESVRTTTQPSKNAPRWLKLVVVIYERMSEGQKED